MALWFSGTILLAAIPMLPAAGAQAPFSAQLEPPALVFHVRGSGETHTYDPNVDGFIRKDDKLRFFFNLTWSTAACTFTDSLTGARTGTPRFSSAEIDARSIGESATAAPTRSVSVGNNRQEIEYFVQVKQTSSADAETPTGKVILNYKLECYSPEGATGGIPPAATEAAKSGSADSAIFKVDARPPRITGIDSPAFARTVGLLAAATTAGIGTIVNYTPIADDLHFKELTVKATEVGWGTAPIPMASGSNTNIFINESGQGSPAAPSKNGATVKIFFEAVDDFGQKTTEERTITVDNVRPTVAPTGLTGTITRERGSASAVVNYDWTPPAGEPKKALLSVNGAAGVGVTAPTDITASLADVLNTSVNIQMYAVDNGGNVGTAAASSATPRLSSLAYGPVGSVATLLHNTDFETLSFTVVDDPIKSEFYYAHAYLTLERVGFGFLRQGTTGADASHYSTDPGTDKSFHAGLSTRSHSQALTFTNFTDGTLLNGDYRMTIVINGTSGGSLRQVIPFKVDGAAPLIEGIDGATPYVYPSTLGADVLHLVDNNSVRLSLRVHDDSGTFESKLASFTVELVETDGTTVAKFPDGSPVSRTFRKTDCGKATFALLSGTPITCNLAGDHAPGVVVFTDSLFKGELNLTFPGLAPGDYRIRVRAVDNAGNERSWTPDETVADNTYRIGPVLKIVESTTQPFATASKINILGLASYMIPPDVAPFADGQTTTRCHAPRHVPWGPSARLCQVNNVTFEVRNLEADGTETPNSLKPLSASPLATVGGEPRVEFEQTQANLTTNWLDAFQYGPSSGYALPSGVVATKTLQARMVTDLVVDGVRATYRTPWVRVNSELAPALAVQLPLPNWRFNTTGVMPYNLTFDPKSTDGTPSVQYTLFRTAPGTLKATQHSTGNLFLESNEGSLFQFNGTLGTSASPLPDGEYTVRFDAFHLGAMKVSTNRTFFVQHKTSTTPGIEIPAEQPENADARLRDAVADYFDVGPVFNLSYRINHGLMNVTSLANLSFSLTRAVPRDTFGTTLANNTGGFVVDVTDHTPFDDARRLQTNVTVRVKLPPNAADGDTFSLQLRAAADGKWAEGVPEDASNYTATRSVTLKLDRSPPAVGVLHQASNETGDSGGELQIIGFAEDGGSGVARVEVRIYDVARNRTVLWTSNDQAQFQAGLFDGGEAFATSALRPTASPVTASTPRVRDVEGVTPGASTVQWAIHQIERPRLSATGLPIGGKFRPLLQELDATSTYLVTARAVDQLGHASENVSATVRFDTQPPVIVGVDGGSGIVLQSARPGEVGWHGVPTDARFSVNVTDNKAIQRVSLRGFDPEGKAVGPVDMKPAVGVAKVDALLTQTETVGTETWTLNKQTHITYNAPYDLTVTNLDAPVHENVSFRLFRDGSSTPFGNPVSPVDDLEHADRANVTFTNVALAAGVWYANQTTAANGTAITNGTSAVFVVSEQRNQPRTFTLSVREGPTLTDLIGTYRYYVEAEDASGLNASGSTAASMMLPVKVIDTLPPVVRFVNMDPPLIGEDLTSVVRAEVFENHQLDTVEVHVARREASGIVTFLASGKMNASGSPPANGTGLYTLDIGKDLGLSLKKGEYLVQVRANDTAKTCGSGLAPQCQFKSDILLVSDAAPPAITEEGVVGARAFINGTPTLAYRITDKNVQQSGVRLRTGNATENLTAVNATFVPLPGAGGTRVGLIAALAPRNLVSGQKLLVEITATGNLTTTRTFTYTVDTSPPTLNHTVTGLQRIGDKEWAAPATRVALVASDGNGSGIKSFRYLVNNGTLAPYPGTPIAPQLEADKEGTWTLEYEAVDNASNLARGRVSLGYDRKGPVITVSVHSDSPSVIVNDGTGAGLDEGNVTVHYAYNGSASFISKRMERLAGTSNAFSADLPGNASTQGLRYYFEAKDRLGNTGSLFSAAQPHRIEKDGGDVTNDPPTVLITAPEPGAPVRGPVELKWTSLDPENQPLRVSIGLQTPDNPAGTFLVTDGDDNKSFRLETGGLRAGTYTFTLVATDGVRSSEVATRSFVVLAGEVVTPQTVPPPTVQPNTETAFSVGIDPGGKTIQAATFVVTRDGQPFTTGTLRQSAGSYEGSFKPTEPGDYKVSVVVAYTDGSSDDAVQVASVKVPVAPAEAGFPLSLMVLLAIGLLTVALAAYGAFGRWR